MALRLTKDTEHETPAKKLIWGLMELVKAGAIPHHSIQDMERVDKGTMDKAQLTCLVDEFQEQRLEGNATKKDFLKLRDEMAIQHYATLKQVVQINEKASELTSHNQKMKTILVQINDLFEHLDQSLLKRSKADEINNKALLRVISEVTEIRAQLEAVLIEVPQWKKGQDRTTTLSDDMDVDPQEAEEIDRTPNPTEGKVANPIVIGSPTPPSREITNKKLSKPQASFPNKNKKQAGLKNKSGPQQKAQETKTERNPTIVPSPEKDAIELGLGDEKEKAGLFNWKDPKSRPQQNTQESEIEKTPPRWKLAAATDPKTELGLKTTEEPKKKELHIPQDLPIDIPLRDITFQCNKES